MRRHLLLLLLLLAADCQCAGVVPAPPAPPPPEWMDDNHEPDDMEQSSELEGAAVPGQVRALLTCFVPDDGDDGDDGEDLRQQFGDTPRVSCTNVVATVNMGCHIPLVRASGSCAMQRAHSHSFCLQKELMTKVKGEGNLRPTWVAAQSPPPGAEWRPTKFPAVVMRKTDPKVRWGGSR